MLVCGDDSSADYSLVELKKEELNLSPFRFFFFEQINSEK